MDIPSLVIIIRVFKKFFYTLCTNPLIYIFIDIEFLRILENMKIGSVIR